MKKIYLVIGIILILAIVCSPALAISKSDLISQYKGQSAPTIPMPTPIPTQNPQIESIVLPVWMNSTPSRAGVFIDGSFKGITPITINGLSIGTHQLRLSRAGYEDYSTEIVISPFPCFVSEWGSQVCVYSQRGIPIDVTLKKVESTLKPTIPTIGPSPTPKPTPRSFGDPDSIGGGCWGFPSVNYTSVFE